MAKKYTRKFINWREAPFVVDIENYIAVNYPDKEEGESVDYVGLKQKAVAKGFQIFTGIQLVVFIMHFAFSMTQTDIAKTLKANLKLRLKRMSKKTKIKSIIKLDVEYSNKKLRLYKLNMLKIKQPGGRSKMEKYAIGYLKLDKSNISLLTNHSLAEQVSNHKLRPEYNKMVIRLMQSHRTNKSLDALLECKMPPNITQPYVFSLIKGCTKKLKLAFEQEGQPEQMSMFKDEEEL